MRNAILPLILMGCPRQTPVESYSSDVVMTDYDLFENGAYGELRDRLVDRVDPTFGDLFAESDVDDPEAQGLNLLRLVYVELQMPDTGSIFRAPLDNLYRIENEFNPFGSNSLAGERIYCAAMALRSGDGLDDMMNYDLPSIDGCTGESFLLDPQTLYTIDVEALNNPNIR